MSALTRRVVLAAARAVVLPLRALVVAYGQSDIVDYDSDSWVRRLGMEELDGASAGDRFAWLVVRFPEFRNLVHYRLNVAPIPVRLLARAVYRREPTLHLRAESIGRGLVIQHGFSTIVTAERIGEDCWINQQVTIGWTAAGAPVIGDGVRFAVGAVVVGPITIGDGARIGANATVMRDVPAGALMVAPLAVQLERPAAQAAAPTDPATPRGQGRADPQPAG